MAAPPAPRQLGTAFLALAAKTWRHPVSGLDVRFGASTLERWYYRARRAADPVAALKDALRGDEGCFPSLTPVAIAALTLQYREHPGWTAQLPGELIGRFAGPPHEALMRLLIWLSPISVGRGQTVAFKLNEAG